jgi:hypothetical protein
MRPRIGFCPPLPELILEPQDQEVVIHGVLHLRETNTGQAQGNLASQISEALGKFSRRIWSVILYDSCIEYHGRGEAVRYENKWFVRVIKTSDTRNRTDAIVTLLRQRFGRGQVADAEQFAESIRGIVKETFGGDWVVHVAKFRDDSKYLSNCFGVEWSHGGYQVYVMQK